MNVSYTTDTNRGRGGKIREIVFTVIYTNEKSFKEAEEIDEESETTEEKQFNDEEQIVIDTVELLLNEISLEPTKNDIVNIAKAADFDMVVIQNAIDSYITYKKTHKVINVIGYLVKACREKYTTVSSKKKTKIQEQDYDFDQLEEDLFENNVKKESEHQEEPKEKESGIAELASRYGIPQEELLKAIHQTIEEEKTEEIEGQLSFFDQLV